VKNLRVAILGGGDDELQILSEFHKTPGIEIIGIYDRDERAVALEIAEIIGVPTFSDSSFISRFIEADYVIVTEKREYFAEEIEQLKREKVKIINPSEAVDYLSVEAEGSRQSPGAWPRHIEEALQYITRITDRERLLKWLLEISVRSVGASSGSIMLYSEDTRDLYIGYALGLSKEIIGKTRQKLGKGIAGRVASSQTPQLITDLVDTELYKSGRERRRIQSAISVPLIYNEKLLGVINVSTDIGEKMLTENDLDTITKLSYKIAPILEQHMRINAFEIREIEFEVRRYLETLFHNNIDFHEKFNMLCKFLEDKIDADTVTIYTATDEGDWLILGGSNSQISVDGKAPRIHCDKGTLAKSFIEGKEIILTEARSELAELRLMREEGSITTVYLPLKHSRMLGVLVLEFSDFNLLERFLKMKDSLKFQISFFTYSQLKEVRQQRKLCSLEELSQIPPVLIMMDRVSDRADKAVSMVSELVNASMGSLHLEGPDISGTFYYNFPADKELRESLRELDFEFADLVMAKWEPVCRSFISASLEAYHEPPGYKSIVGYPLFKKGRFHAVFIGYNKTPATPVDSSIFGEHELEILKKAGEVLYPIFSTPRGEVSKKPMTFDDLLKSNQRLFVERISEEIMRAERYHHSFTLTLFKINGLDKLFKDNYNLALSFINSVSIGVRARIRKTDFFSWLEVDTFGILSIERYQRVGRLEKRVIEFINRMIQERIGDFEGLLYPVTGYASFPGAAETASDLINEARKSLEK